LLYELQIKNKSTYNVYDNSSVELTKEAFNGEKNNAAKQQFFSKVSVRPCFNMEKLQFGYFQYFLSFTRHPLSNMYIKGYQRGMCPFLLGGLKRVSRASHLQEYFGLVRGLKWPQVDIKVTCNQRRKTFESISIF
jgi:hypothetical protein